MKKISSLILVIVFLAIAFTSCKTHEKCPAYSKLNTAKPLTEVKS